MNDVSPKAALRVAFTPLFCSSKAASPAFCVKARSGSGKLHSLPSEASSRGSTEWRPPAETLK